MPFSAPTGFMVPPLPGVFVAVSCSGTLEQGGTNRGLPSVSEPTQITLLSLLFEFSSCARFTRALLLVWDVARHGLSTPFLKKHVIFLFRYSFCHTSNLYPLPFSATTQVIDNHTRYTFSYPMRQLYFVCKRCWTYSRHVSVLHEPCWGCHILESDGWEFWTPGRGRSAWWRHPYWMFILIFCHTSHWSPFPFFSHQPGDDQSHEEHRTKSDGKIIFCLHTLLALFTSRIHPPWTLSGLCHIRKHGMGILNTRQGEVCMVAPPLLDVHFLIYSIRFPLDHTRCNDFPKLAHSS